MVGFSEGFDCPGVPLICVPPFQCLDFNDGSLTGDMCDDLCVLGLVEYKRCLYYENGKKVIEARWRGNPIILKSKLENFSSYEPLGILDYQVSIPFYSCVGKHKNVSNLSVVEQDAAEDLSPLDVVFYTTMEVSLMSRLWVPSQLCVRS